MRRLTITAIGVLVALAVAGLAATALIDNGAARSQHVSASFTATSTAGTSSSTCSGADGTYRVTRGSYTGTASGDARLTGRILVRSKAVVNVTTGHGWTAGILQVRDQAGKLKATASLIGVNSGSGDLNGIMLGRVLGPSARLVANFSASFNAAGTTLSGQLGSDAPALPHNAAVAVSGSCDARHGQANGRSKK